MGYGNHAGHQNNSSKLGGSKAKRTSSLRIKRSVYHDTEL